MKLGLKSKETAKDIKKKMKEADAKMGEDVNANTMLQGEKRTGLRNGFWRKATRFSSHGVR